MALAAFILWLLAVGYWLTEIRRPASRSQKPEARSWKRQIFNFPV
jgi:hypothetical protein